MVNKRFMVLSGVWDYERNNIQLAMVEMGIKSEIRITNRIVPRERDGKCASRTVTVTSGGGSSDIEELSDWFLSSVSDDEAKGVINFLKGIKISGHD